MFAEEQKKGPLQAGRAGDFLRKASPKEESQSNSRSRYQIINDLQT